MNKEQQELLDKAYSEYGDSHWTSPENPNGGLLDQLWSVKPMQHSKESFVNECKTNKKFSKKWDLKIEERKLSGEERMKILEQKHPLYWMEQQLGGEDILTRNNVPTKLITVTYNDKTIENYE